MDQELTTTVEQLSHVPALRSDYRITNATDLDEANALLNDLMGKINQLKKIREKEYEPVYASTCNLRDFFDRPIKAVTAVKEIVRLECKRYLDEQEAKRLAAKKAEDEKNAAELRKLEAKRAAAEAAGKSTAKIEAKMVEKALAPALIPEPVVVPEGLNKFTHKTGKYKYCDKNGEESTEPDMSIIPLWLHLPDTAQLNSLAKAPGKKQVIPGIIFYQA